MGRSRIIHAEFFVHEGLYDAEQATGLPIDVCFAGLWGQADREGRFRWRPRELKAAIRPHHTLDFRAVLDALVLYGFIEKYEVDGESYGRVINFRKYQRIHPHEAASRLPPSPSEPSSNGGAPKGHQSNDIGKPKVTQRRARARKLPSRTHTPEPLRGTHHKDATPESPRAALPKIPNVQSDSELANVLPMVNQRSAEGVPKDASRCPASTSTSTSTNKHLSNERLSPKGLLSSAHFQTPTRGGGGSGDSRAPFGGAALRAAGGQERAPNGAAAAAAAACERVAARWPTAKSVCTDGPADLWPGFLAMLPGRTVDYFCDALTLALTQGLTPNDAYGAVADWIANNERPNIRKFRNYLRTAPTLPDRAAQGESLDDILHRLEARDAAKGTTGGPPVS